MNYNKLSSIPPELGECENLEKLEMTGNLNLSELPFEVMEISYSYSLIDHIPLYAKIYNKPTRRLLLIHLT